MDAFPCPPFPHYVWFAHWLVVRPPRIFDIHECRHVTHRLMLTTDGDADVRWATRGEETAFHATSGTIGFFPRDRDTHAMSITTAAGFRAYEVLVPDGQIGRVAAAEGVRPFTDFRAVPAFRDALLEASLLRLSMRVEGHQVAEDIGDEVAARQIIIRLCATLGGRPPEWHSDTSVFAPALMRRIAECIDADLGSHVSLENLAATFACSPGHFARKFRHSCGLSLSRYINKRRIGMSFAMLRQDFRPLSGIALDLGFCSQSHFTRLFSSLTGITPLQFRRLHMRMGE